jgi:hypothetical protein
MRIKNSGCRSYQLAADLEKTHDCKNARLESRPVNDQALEQTGNDMNATFSKVQLCHINITRKRTHRCKTFFPSTSRTCMQIKQKLFGAATAAVLALCSGLAHADWTYLPYGQGAPEEGGCAEIIYYEPYTYYSDMLWEIPPLHNGESVVVMGRYWSPTYNNYVDSGVRYTFTCNNGTVGEPTGY